jgi:hypothetical protein
MNKFDVTVKPKIKKYLEGFGIPQKKVDEFLDSLDLRINYEQSGTIIIKRPDTTETEKRTEKKTKDGTTIICGKNNEIVNVEIPRSSFKKIIGDDSYSEFERNSGVAGRELRR